MSPTCTLEAPARGRETVLPGEFGVFYDLGTGMAGNAINGLANRTIKRLLSVPFPLAPYHADTDVESQSSIQRVLQLALKVLFPIANRNSSGKASES